ncbi:hypothetical protein AGMMS49975_08440 [Clostridia bacterium]|nr:hypothetical protein AGMMS49975_08440 [Clostridia bacterium]
MFVGCEYVCVKYDEFTEYYKGNVPEEYRIVSSAMCGLLRAKEAGRGNVEIAPNALKTLEAERPDGYTSVLTVIEKSKTAPKPPHKTKSQTKSKSTNVDRDE